LPQTLLADAKGALEGIRSDSSSEWQKMLTELQVQLGSSYSKMLAGITAEAAQIRDSVTVVSRQLNAVAANSSGALNNLSELPSGILKGVDSSFGELANQCLTTWKETSDAFGRDVERYYREYIRVITEETKEIKESLRGAEKSWADLAANSNSLIQDSIKTLVRESRDQLEDSLRNVNNLLESRIPQVSGEVEKFTGGLEQLLLQTGELQGEYSAWLGHTQTAKESMRDIQNELAKALEKLRQGGEGKDGRDVALLLQTNIERLEGTNQLLKQIQERIPAKGNGIDSEIQQSRKLLQDIKRDINDLATRKSLFGKTLDRLPRLRLWGNN
jgi:uncharacterized phage infection (PIP) family protein YhgE